MSQYQYATLLQGGNPLFDGNAFTNIAGSNRSQPFSIVDTGAESLVFNGTVDDITPAGKAFTVADTTNIVTAASHGFYTGLVCQVTTSGALPSPLVVSTDYYVYRINANTFKLATSLANCLAGTFIDFLDQGSPANTITPVAMGDVSTELQGSFDGSNWFTIPNTDQTVTEDTVLTTVELDYLRYPLYALYVTVTTGMINISPCQIGYKLGE